MRSACVIGSLVFGRELLLLREVIRVSPVHPCFVSPLPAPGLVFKFPRDQLLLFISFASKCYWDVPVFDHLYDRYLPVENSFGDISGRFVLSVSVYDVSHL